MFPASHQLSLKLLEKCPSCTAMVPQKNIQVIDEGELYVLAHISCGSCSAKHLASIAAYPQGIMGNAIPTDLTAPEAMDALMRKALTENDVLELYRLIHGDRFASSFTTTTH